MHEPETPRASAFRLAQEPETFPASAFRLTQEPETLLASLRLTQEPETFRASALRLMQEPAFRLTQELEAFPASASRLTQELETCTKSTLWLFMGPFTGFSGVGFTLLLLLSSEAPFFHVFWHVFQKEDVLTTRIEEADYILLPFGYEFIIEYTEADYFEKGYTKEDYISAHTCFTQANQLSVSTGKPMVVIHYRDSAEPFGLPNAMVFRTSIFASTAEKNTFCLPAFVDGFTQNNQPWQPVEWMPKPSLSFRGLSAPLQLPHTIQARMLINKLADNLSINGKIKTYFPEGYLVRRAAILALRSRENIVRSEILINATSTRTRATERG
jgi:hypothetical protein